MTKLSDQIKAALEQSKIDQATNYQRAWTCNPKMGKAPLHHFIAGADSMLPLIVKLVEALEISAIHSKRSQEALADLKRELGVKE